MWANIDEIPQLIRSINEMKKTVDTFSGELQSMNKRIHQNDKDLGKHEMRIDAAFRNLDLVIRKIEL